MERVKIPNEKKAKQLLVQLIQDIQTDVSDEPRILVSIVSLLVGAVVATKTISSEEMISSIINHLIENDMFNPIEITKEEMFAMHEMPNKNKLN